MYLVLFYTTLGSSDKPKPVLASLWQPSEVGILSYLTRGSESLPPGIAS